MEQTTAGDSLHAPPLPLIYIPFDIIPETILCRLSVKSLLRFRCVCKPWDLLVSKDLKFAKKHLRVSPKRQHLITTTWRKAEKLTVMSCPFDSLNLHSNFDSKSTQLDYSPIISTYEEGLIASCDGLICFVIDNRLAVLYNPCIRKVKKLPYIDHLPRVQGLTIYAFGYDPFIDNYKVVAVFCYGRFDHNYKNQVKVHSVGTDSWRRIMDFPSMFRLDRRGKSQHGIFVSGTVNWLTDHILNRSYGGTAIVSLHLGDESYQEIPLPDLENLRLLTLDVMRDCLCIFFRKSSDSCTDVWVMKEYGNKESWIKLIRLPYFGSSRYFYTNIVYISEDDNHVLLVFNDNKFNPKSNRKFNWVVYDLENNTIKSSEIHDNLGLVKSKVYVESLISL